MDDTVSTPTKSLDTTLAFGAALPYVILLPSKLTLPLNVLLSIVSTAAVIVPLL